MNSITKNTNPVFQLYQEMRHQMMNILNDNDLNFRIKGANSTLGELCCEIGKVEYAYIQYFKVLKQDFSYRKEEPGAT